MSGILCVMNIDYEDFVDPPTGGRFKLAVLGIIIPAMIAYFAVSAWLEELAYLPGRRGGMMLHGESARAMAVVYMSVALFIHCRWFWGLIQSERVYKIGQISSLFIFLVALIWSLSVL